MTYYHFKTYAGSQKTYLHITAVNPTHGQSK